MSLLTLLARAVLIYLAIVVIAALVVSQVYGLKQVQGQMALLFCLVAGLPAAFKAARGFAA